MLLLHSFARDFAPTDAFSETFRAELAQQMEGAGCGRSRPHSSQSFERCYRARSQGRSCLVSPGCRMEPLCSSGNSHLRGGGRGAL